MKELDAIIESGLRFEARQKGRTTALIKAAREIGATFGCVNMQHATEIAHANKGLVCTHLQGQQRGKSTVVIWDHFAIEQMASRAKTRISHLEAQVDGLNRRNDELAAMVARANGLIRKLEIENEALKKQSNWRERWTEISKHFLPRKG